MTVLELVKLVQAGLVIFGMYGFSGSNDNDNDNGYRGSNDNDNGYRGSNDDGNKDGSRTAGAGAGRGTTLPIDGLLCDVTVEGIQRWVGEIGEPCVGVEVGFVFSCPDLCLFFRFCFGFQVLAMMKCCVDEVLR